MNVHEKLRTLARKRGVSNAEIGRNTGISRGRISQFMTTSSRPKAWQITALADYFGVAADSLMDDRLPLRYTSPGAAAGLPADAVAAPGASPINNHERLILEMSRALGYERATRRLLGIGLEEALAQAAEATRTPAPTQAQAPSPAPESITPAAASPGPEPAPSGPGPATQGGAEPPPPIIPIRAIDSSTTAADLPSPPPADPADPADPGESREPRGDRSRQGPPGGKGGKSSQGRGK